MGALELELDDKTLKAMLKLVHQHTGITMTEKKKALLQSRLRPRLRELKLVTYEDYITYLRDHQDEVDTFIDKVTTNETYFFRTPRVWNFFNQKFLTSWMKDHPGETLKIWSAAASSGEEIYSIAISCLEFKANHPGFKFELHATDISQDILKTATAGIYGARSVDGIKKYHPDWLMKHLSHHGDDWKISDEIKKHVKFGQHNLMKDVAQRNTFDIVFLRNVMIYFQEAEQRIVLGHMMSALKKDGVLILGESESIGRLDTGLQFVEPLVYKK